MIKNNSLRFISTREFSRAAMYVLLVTATVVGISTYFYIKTQTLGPEPGILINLILGNLVVLLSTLVIVTRHIFYYRSPKGSALQRKIIFMSSLVTAIPTVIISIFAIYFFYFGVQMWFDQRISKLLDQSSHVAKSYIEEHMSQLRETAFTISKILHHELTNNPQQIQDQLRTHAKLRSIDEAIIFDPSTGTIVAQTLLSFSLSFTNVPAHLLERAKLGEAVPIRSDKNKVRVLTKLGVYSNHYLLIGRLVDRKILDHIDETNSTVQDYIKLRDRTNTLQVEFSFAFCIFTLILLMSATAVGSFFGTGMVKRVKKLLDATEQVKKGDLNIRVNINDRYPDEISSLSEAFNNMVQQLEHQKRHLIIAQRALAWSDIARRVAHEIKNPLTPIQLAAEMIEKKFANQVQDVSALQRYIQIILRHTGDIRKILSEFVNFAKLPSPVFEDCELVSVIKELVSSRKAIKDGITYHFNSSEPYLNFRCDLTQIHQIIVNLFKNAEEAIEGMHDPVININLQKHLSDFELMVTDNGKGFAEDSINRVSEAYFTTRANGTGLGLAIVKKIVEDHHGSVEFGNSKEGGACVRLIFSLSNLDNKLIDKKISNQ